MQSNRPAGQQCVLSDLARAGYATGKGEVRMDIVGNTSVQEGPELLSDFGFLPN